MQKAASRLIREEKDYLVLFKPGGLDTVPLKKERGKPSLLSYASELYPEVLECGSTNYWEGGVLHRLDRLTEGLVLIARNQSFYDKMSEEQASDRFIKRYRAITEKTEYSLGFPSFPYELKEGLVIKSKFRKYGVKGKSVRPLLPDSDLSERIYSTTVEKTDENVFFLSLSRGFRHQIRAHLAWSGNAIAGDELYGAEKSEGFFGLLSYSLSFLGEEISISIEEKRGEAR